MKNKPNILIVDDEEMNRDLLESMLEEDYRIYQAEDGKKAMDFLNAGAVRIHLILLDINMPVMDGFDVLEALQKNEDLKRIPAIVISGDSNSDTIIHAYTLGAADYFPKPFVAGIVRRSVENTLEIASREYKDPVTGNFNRRGFILEAQVYFNSLYRKEYSLVYFDIKNFRAYNESFGTDGGNEILNIFSAHIENSFLHPVVMARSETDHMIALVRSENISLYMMPSILTCKYEKDGKSAVIHAVAGICNLIDADSVAKCIDCARITSDNIQDEYVQPYKEFDSKIKDEFTKKMAVISGFEKAIDNKEFVVFYQPVIEVRTGRLASAEALVRWVSPENGFVSPGVFIPTLEQNGYVTKLDEYIVKRVYDEMRERIEDGRPAIPVSCNLSWIDFYDKDIRDTIKTMLDKNKDINEYIRYEVTESSMAALNNDSSSDFLNFLNENNMKLLLDDFGSGYSSYFMLAQHSFDILKIDMSITRKLDQDKNIQSIISNIVNMCHEIGLRVVAEGAENQFEVDFLRDHGCDYIQGYYYSKPLSRADFEEFVASYAKEGKIVKNWDDGR